MRKLILMALALFAFPSALAADIVIFKSGAAKVGIIEEETPTTVKIRVRDAVVGISRGNIEKIDYATPEENEELELKWRDEKERREEERRLKQEQRKKLEEERKGDGLVKFGDEWMSPAEAEKRRQQGVRQQVQAEKARSEAEQTAEPSEEAELPEFIRSLPEDQKRLYLEDIEKRKKIEISQITTQPQGLNTTMLKCVVTNKSQSSANTIEVEVECYDEAGELLLVESGRVFGLEPDESGSLYVTLQIGSEFIKRTEVQVVDVRWR